MAATADRGAGLGVRARKAAACCLTTALLTTACAGSAPRLTPPSDMSAADREACEGLAEKAKAAVSRDSVLGGVATGAAGGALLSVRALAGRDASASLIDRDRSLTSSGSQDGLMIGALLGSIVAIGAIVAGGAALADNVSTRDAAYADAMDACLRPAVLTREVGPEHPEVARSLRALGYRYYRQGELAKAEPLYIRALAIQEKALGADNPEVAGFLDDYAAVLERTGREVEAQKLKQRARAIRVKW